MARARKDRRAADRAAVKDAKRRLAAAELEPGGAPERPLVIATSHLVEPVAQAKPCPVCGGAVRALDHTAEVVHGRSLRAARVRCQICGVERRLWFALQADTLN